MLENKSKKVFIISISIALIFIVGMGVQRLVHNKPSLKTADTNLKAVSTTATIPPRQMEKLDRGVVAVLKDNGVYVGWRMFGTEPDSTSFNIYRDGAKVNEKPITASTNYLDTSGTVIGDANADYREKKSDSKSLGYVLAGPEYLTVFNGQTGAAVTTISYEPERGNVSDWGDTYGNRVDRFLACVAYLDGVHPSVVMCRGYYTRTVLVAYDFKNNQLNKRWVFDSNNGYKNYAGQGNHNL